MKKRTQKLLSLFLSAMMLVSVVPSSAYAAPETSTEEAAAQEESQETEETVEAEVPETESEADTEEAVVSEETAAQKDSTVDVTGNISIKLPVMQFKGANAAVAEALTKDVVIDENDPAIQGMKAALENLEIAGGEAEEDGVSAIATYDAEEPANPEEKKGLSEEQIQTVLAMYQQYLDQWTDNAEYLGVQNPFFLDFNDNNADGLGVLGEMLALAGVSVESVRNGSYSYDDLTGMIINFTYGDKLGIQYYGKDVTGARDEALNAVAASGAQTYAQKLLVINDWLAHANTFDMSYIMNSNKKSDDEKPMIAKDPQPQEHEKDVHDVIYSVYEPQIRQNFYDNVFAAIEDNLRQTFYEQAILDIVYKNSLGKSEEEATDEEKQAAKEQAQAYLDANKDNIDADPDGFVRSNFGDEAADQLKAQADAFIADAEENGVAVDPDHPDYKMTVDQLTEQRLKSEDKNVDIDGDGTPDLSFEETIGLYSEQAAAKMTTGVINYWEGSQFGAFGMGTSVCLGYSKAFSYLVQCLDKEIYLKTPSAGYESSNWKTAKELYYGEDGQTININAGYTVDLVRISFQSDVTMYGEEQEDFASDHYWNAVRVDGTWYYVDPCYTDVYTEVMSRDRVETDGDMNHVFFLFSDTSARKLYDGNFSELRSLYTNVATNKTYETAWMSRAASNVYYADGYAYYMYDSTDLFARVNSSSMNQSASEYKLVRHKLSSNDATDGDSDYETLVNFTDKENSDDDDTFVSVLNKDGVMEKNDLLTKLYAQFTNDQKQYPSLSLTAALYDGKMYFNLSNDVLAYDLSENTVAVVKEYNTVSAKRDTTQLFGGMAFTTTSEENADFTVNNHPIAGLTVKGDKLIVSIGTNFAFISGKSEILDHSSYGYEFEETDYNPNYTNYKKYQQFMGEQKNDNDEFMWSANFVDTVDLKTLTGTSHNYETVSVPATCGRNAFTEERCSDCGLIKEGTRVEEESTAHEHHYIKFHEVYYTKDSNGNWNEADNYVCTDCGASITEPVKSNFSQAQSNYEERKAIWEAAQKNAAEGHAYVAQDAVVNEDNTITFQNLRCESCYAQKDKLDCLLASDENEINKANYNSIEKTLEEPLTVDAEIVSSTSREVTYKAEGKTEDGTRYTALGTKTPTEASVYYEVHRETYGWEVDTKDEADLSKWKKDGQESGTVGESKRLEGIRIKLPEGVDGSIEYRTHIEGTGWETEWKKDGEMSGTSGQSRRLEAIQIRLTGEIEKNYDVYYSVHAQEFGWLGWAKNGEEAGTAGYAYRLEAIRILLVPKGAEAPAPIAKRTNAMEARMVTYQTHVQGYGNQAYVYDGAVAGTQGESKRMESIRVKLASTIAANGGIRYRSHIQDLGWEKDWKTNGALSGTTGRSLRLEAIQLELTGAIAEKYDVYYRVHAQNFGWLGWAKNGEEAGTAGFSYRLEGIQIVLVPKGTVDPVLPGVASARTESFIKK